MEKNQQKATSEFPDLIQPWNVWNQLKWIVGVTHRWMSIGKISDLHVLFHSQPKKAIKNQVNTFIFFTLTHNQKKQYKKSRELRDNKKYYKIVWQKSYKIALWKTITRFEELVTRCLQLQLLWIVILWQSWRYFGFYGNLGNTSVFVATMGILEFSQ